MIPEFIVIVIQNHNGNEEIADVSHTFSDAERAAEYAKKYAGEIAIFKKFKIIK